MSIVFQSQRLSKGSTVQYSMWCLSNLCLSFLELFQEKEAEMEGEGVGVDQHMVSRYYQVFR